MRRRTALGLFMALAMGLGVADCAVNPATGQREISLISEAQEIEMGNQADQDVVASMGLYDDDALQAYVTSLGERLAAASERPNLPWTFRVVDDPVVNAFALPGGHIFVTRGILSHLRSEAELAGVLGHEIGHVTARHSVSQMSRAQLTQLGVGLGMIFVPQLRPFGDLASAGMQLLFLKYSRDDESQADMLGVRYMSRLSYDPNELADVMRMLQRSSEIEGGGRVPEWMSTHPDPGNRANRIAELVQESGVPPDAVVRREEYVNRLDGLVFGPNPREGIFRDNVFHHPELAFRFDFPQGWKTANSKQAVQGMSPDEDAALEITLATGSPAGALRDFGMRDGVTLGRTSQQRVNGLSAARGEFQISTDNGTFVGRVLYVSHGSNTYQVLGYAPEARWSRNAAPVEESMASFAPETDRAILGLQPDRLDIVRMGSTLTFDAFLERYSGRANPDIVALINGVESGDSVERGTLVKTIVAGS